MEIVKVFYDGFWKFDFLIVIMAFVNWRIFSRVRTSANKIYEYFNPHDRTRNLSESGKNNLRKHMKKREEMTEEALLNIREKMNKNYALYANLTTMFPLFGMFGTVWALIPMVNSIGTSATSNFFSALTSTAWGIVFAMLFKFLDARISYKIEDNEKHTEYLMFPKE